MSPPTPSTNKLTGLQQKVNHFHLGTSCKTLALTSTLVIFLLYALFSNPPGHFSPSPPEAVGATAATNLSHIVFGLVGSMNTLKQKKPYVESWWRPNATRGYLFLDRPPSGELSPWPPSLPPFRVNEDIRNWTVYPRFVRPAQMRIVRTVLETVMEGDEGVRWYVMGDDDTVLIVDNLVEVLGGYDHEEMWYIGTNSESIKSNVDFSFEMAFGGAGYALSYPLAKVLAIEMDGCLERYWYSYSSDFSLHSCIADLGVALTHHNGFHQIDLHNDISGLLSAHSQSPLLSLHHIDTIDPIFPSRNRTESITHLMEAAKLDHSRLLQQTISYDRSSNRSFSVSWGYSVHIYESVLPRSVLRRPLETFRPWKRGQRPPFYMFNTRTPSNDSCTSPHVFFFESLETRIEDSMIVTLYARDKPRGLDACSSSGNNSADHVSKILVYSPSTPRRKGEMNRIECGDVGYGGADVAEVRLRACRGNEVIA